MPIVFACAASHAPGITAWADAASEQQSQAVNGGFGALKDALKAANPETLLILTSEHWANFFLDHASAFCIGRGDTFEGPVEPWLKLERRTIGGNPSLATHLLEHCYAHDFEPSHSHELAFDHGTMVPLSLITPGMDQTVVPLYFNTLATPRPSARRCLALGKILRPALEAWPQRVGIIATGGLSHDPGELNHGVIDTAFDHRFLNQVSEGQLEQLAAYSDTELRAAGAGTLELLAWICLAGIMAGEPARIVAYQPVKPWATGIGMVAYDRQAA